MLQEVQPTELGRSLLALASFSIGIGALLWLLRRRIGLLSRKAEQSRMDLRPARAVARSSIDAISSREWLAKHRSAVIFIRDGPPLSEENSAFLAAVTLRQQAGKGG
ncbi:hypothetical protein IIA79_04595 [bacterium]|nr:hypothetical protein [bacterium]